MAKKTIKKSAKKVAKKAEVEKETKVIPIPEAQPQTKEAGDKNMRDAQYRKGLSIAFFNATNAAIELVKGSDLPFADKLAEITKVRDHFIEEHKNYYSAVVAQVGTNYSVEESVKKLRAVKSLEALHIVWLEFSEDERRDMEIVRVAQEMKKKYEKS